MTRSSTTLATFGADGLLSVRRGSAQPVAGRGLRLADTWIRWPLASALSHSHGPAPRVGSGLAARNGHAGVPGAPLVGLRIGVLGVQGAVSEHADALRRAASALDLEIEVVTVRRPEDIEGVAGLVIPGGESTTISRLLRSSGLQPAIVERASRGDLAVFGTCAGLVLVSSRASHDVQEKDVQLLRLIDAEVDRNAFGRQRESFEAVLDIEGVGTMPCVFIRAPALDAVGKEVDVLATFKDRIVAVRQGNVLGAAFHPELTPDTRLHELFIRMAQEAQAG